MGVIRGNKAENNTSGKETPRVTYISQGETRNAMRYWDRPSRMYLVISRLHVVTASRNSEPGKYQERHSPMDYEIVYISGPRRGRLLSEKWNTLVKVTIGSENSPAVLDVSCLGVLLCGDCYRVSVSFTDLCYSWCSWTS